MPRRALPLGAALAIAAMLAGCQSAPQQETAPLPPPVPPAPLIIAIPIPAEAAVPDHPVQPPTPAPHPAALALERTDAILRLSAPELAKEITRLSEKENEAVDNALLLAVALGQTRQAVDTARALGLVQRVLGNDAADARALHPLARLLEARLIQHRRIEDQLDKQNQQLRDLQRRNEQLNERLEAVRAIERSLTTRPGPSSPPTNAAPASAPQRPAP